jgi:polysaccharide pyruvyl transferase WcaK-like protein
MAYEDDFTVGQAIAKRYPDLVLAPRFTGPSEAKTYIANMDLFLGSRMHATIAALSSNTAVLPLGYSRKFSGLFGSLGYSWNSDLTQDSAQDVMAKLEAALADIPALTSEASAANETAQLRLANYIEFLGTIIRERVGANV